MTSRPEAVEADHFEMLEARPIATTKVPNKPAAAGVASPLSIVLVWAAGELGLVVPPEVAAAFVATLVSAAYWLVPARE